MSRVLSLLALVASASGAVQEGRSSPDPPAHDLESAAPDWTCREPSGVYRLGPPGCTVPDEVSTIIVTFSLLSISGDVRHGAKPLIDASSAPFSFKVIHGKLILVNLTLAHVRQVRDSCPMRRAGLVVGPTRFPSPPEHAPRWSQVVSGRATDPLPGIIYAPGTATVDCADIAFFNNSIQLESVARDAGSSTALAVPAHSIVYATGGGTTFVCTGCTFGSNAMLYGDAPISVVAAFDHAEVDCSESIFLNNSITSAADVPVSGGLIYAGGATKVVCSGSIFAGNRVSGSARGGLIHAAEADTQSEGAEVICRDSTFDSNRILHRCEGCMVNGFYTPQGTTIYAAVQGGLIWARDASLDFSGSKFVANAVLPSGSNTPRSNLVQGGLVYIRAGDAANFSGAVFSQVPCEMSCAH